MKIIQCLMIIEYRQVFDVADRYQTGDTEINIMKIFTIKYENANHICNCRNI